MDIPQLQAELAAKADDVVRKGHRCNGSVFDGEAMAGAKDLDVG